MLSLTDHLSSELYWVQPKAMQRAFELRAGEGVVGSLRFETAFGSLATARANGKAWSLKRMGFFRPHVTVRVAGGTDDIAVYRPRWTGTEGELAFAGGSVYHWDVANFWATHYEVKDREGNPLIAYRSGGVNSGMKGLFKRQAIVEVTDRGRSEPDIDLLILIGWYLIILQQEDSAATAAVVVSTAAVS